MRALLLEQTRKLRLAYLRVEPADEANIPELTGNAANSDNLKNMIRVIEYFNGQRIPTATKTPIVTTKSNQIAAQCRDLLKIVFEEKGHLRINDPATTPVAAPGGGGGGGGVPTVTPP
jgi:hypothetical protein